MRERQRTRQIGNMHGRERGTENAPAAGGDVDSGAPGVNARAGTSERSRDGTVVVEE
jgi:hypothetical protein